MDEKDPTRRRDLCLGRDLITVCIVLSHYTVLVHNTPPLTLRILQLEHKYQTKTELSKTLKVHLTNIYEIKRVDTTQK